jgi:hypothetical protein
MSNLSEKFDALESALLGRLNTISGKLSNIQNSVDRILNAIGQIEYYPAHETVRELLKAIQMGIDTQTVVGQHSAGAPPAGGCPGYGSTDYIQVSGWVENLGPEGQHQGLFYATYYNPVGNTGLSVVTLDEPYANPKSFPGFRTQDPGSTVDICIQYADVADSVFSIYAVCRNDQEPNYWHVTQSPPILDGKPSGNNSYQINTDWWVIHLQYTDTSTTTYPTANIWIRTGLAS